MKSKKVESANPRLCCRTWPTPTRKHKHTPTDTETQSRLQVRGECDRLGFRFNLFLFVWMIVSLFVPPTPPSHPPYLSSPLVRLSAFSLAELRAASCAYSTALWVHLNPRRMCALHVRRTALSYWYTFYAKHGARAAQRWRGCWTGHMDARRGSPWPPDHRHTLGKQTSNIKTGEPNLLFGAAGQMKPRPLYFPAPREERVMH